MIRKPSYITAPKDITFVEDELYIIQNELSTLDLSRIDLNNKLTSLTPDELQEAEQKLRQHLAL